MFPVAHYKPHWLILSELLEAFHKEPTSPFVNYDQLYKTLKNNISNVRITVDLVKQIILELENLGLAEIEFVNNNEQQRAVITSTGVYFFATERSPDNGAQVHFNSNQQPDRYAAFIRNGAEEVKKGIQLNGYRSNINTQALDQNLIDVLKRIDDVIEVLVKSNSISPEKRNETIQNLEKAKKLLSSKKVALAVISALLFQPVYSAASDLMEEAAKNFLIESVTYFREKIGF